MRPIVFVTFTRCQEKLEEIDELCESDKTALCSAMFFGVFYTGTFPSLETNSQLLAF